VTVFVQSHWVDNTDPPPSAIYSGGNATGGAEIIDKWTVYNNDVVDVNYKVFIGGTDDSNIVLSVDVAAGESYLCGELVGHDLAVGDAIYELAATASVLSSRFGGRPR
jgi:hypothetical protein